MDFQDWLILFGAPILVVVTVFTVVFLRHPRPQSRYRAGRPYDFKPVWFVARSVAAPGDTGSHAAALDAAHGEALASGPKGGSHGKW
ncbi:hypothetical protein [Glycomyces terrestris]|uniref:Uncharacterized protein n=1 Tax=Glycomyces terrestris TaxID=2493553 RepID=A0A426V566_9ACTN|nr:hypothetical protein [Glycomyces terrestris]RRS02037.1 hypothetical protein EIW28_04685 [Glycomyces terrestris]